MKKLLAGSTLAALALGSVVATAAPAAAHTPEIKADCTGLTVNLTYYASQGNHVTILVNDKELDAQKFGREFKEYYAWADYDIDPADVESWIVEIDASDADRFDSVIEGGMPEECTPAPEPVAVSPEVPAVDCDVTSVDQITKPEDTEAITYSQDERGITATLNDGSSWGDLGPYTQESRRTALLPVEALTALITEQECATEPVPPVVTPTPTASESATPSPTPTEESPAPVASAEPSVSPSASADTTPSPSPSATADNGPKLAETGAKVGGAVALALLLVGGGLTLVWARRRMQNS